MRYGICFLVVALCLVSLSGCSCDQSKQGATGQSGTVITSGNFERIVGMQWILEKMTVGAVEYPLAGEKPFVKFDADGGVNGHASINRFFGGVEINKNGHLKWSDAFGSTRMAGPEKLMNQENAFLGALPTTEQVSMDKIFLTLQTKDGKTELVFYVPVE